MSGTTEKEYMIQATPARYATHVFGGVKMLADALHLTVSAVNYWLADAPNGLSGRIPSKHMQGLLLEAHRRHLKLSPEHVVHGGLIPIEGPVVVVKKAGNID